MLTLYTFVWGWGAIGVLGIGYELTFRMEKVFRSLGGIRGRLCEYRNVYAFVSCTPGKVTPKQGCTKQVYFSSKQKNNALRFPEESKTIRK